LLEDDPWPRLSASEPIPPLTHSNMISEKCLELPNEIAKSNLPPSGATLKDSGPQEEKCSKALALRIHESYSNGLSVSLSPSNSANSGTDQKGFKVSPNGQTKAQDAERTPTANFKRTLEESNSGPAMKKPRRGLSRSMSVPPEGMSATAQRRNSRLAMRRSLRGQKKLSTSLFHPPRKAVCVC
ncbi:PREDICTED: protein phosphatase 1D-like, partial [Nestor notabilis]|uniref:protein phosphatase 1D-like n=1 Tax=Nestor notabilis TaxID=176057 RepID=UPI0005239E2D